MRIFALAVTLLASLVAGADDNCTKPPAGAIIVDRSGSNGGYRTIGEAVEKLDGQADKQVLFIYPGTYSERVVISKLKGTLVLQGYTCDKMSYRKNEVTITYKKSQLDLAAEGGVVSNERASTLSINTDQVQVYNLNLVNTAIQTRDKGQAPALSVICKTCAFYACSITGHQDTLYANRGNQLYARSHVAGTVDFIFGNARAFFQSCDIESVVKDVSLPTANLMTPTSCSTKLKCSAHHPQRSTSVAPGESTHALYSNPLLLAISSTRKAGP